MLKAWQKEIGFRSCKISVRSFFDEQKFLGIRDYPTHFEQTLTDPTSDKAFKADIRRAKTQWEKEKHFVLMWGEEIWMDESGEVLSS